MNRDDVLNKVQIVFREVFDDPNIQISDNTVASDIEEWDSLNHISLIASLEEAFKIKFSMAEILGFKNVGNMIDKICEKL